MPSNTTVTSFSILAAPVSVLAATVTLITPASTSIPGRKGIRFPLQSITGTIFVLITTVGSAAPSVSDLTNYGRAYTALNEDCALEISSQINVYAYSVNAQTISRQEFQ